LLPALSLWAVSSFCASRPSARSVLSRSGAWGGATGPAWSGASTKFILIRRRGR